MITDEMRTKNAAAVAKNDQVQTENFRLKRNGSSPILLLYDVRRENWDKEECTCIPKDWNRGFLHFRTYTVDNGVSDDDYEMLEPDEQDKIPDEPYDAEHSCWVWNPSYPDGQMDDLGPYTWEADEIKELNELIQQLEPEPFPWF